MNSYIYKPPYISTVFEIILKYEEDGTLYFLLTSDQYKIYVIENQWQNEAAGIKHHVIFRGFQILQEIFKFSLKVSGNCRPRSRSRSIFSMQLWTMLVLLVFQTDSVMS